ncbi:MAG: membrane protein insertase YidC [Alphaproteobacteria bacterium]|nr:membrane protein insertase YidC [Alphaproteobacteria bacterium]
MVKYIDNNSGFNQWASMQQQKKSSRFSGFFWWLILFLFAWWIMGVWFKPQNAEIAAPQPIAVEQSNATKQNINADEISIDVQGLRISNITLNKHKKDSGSDEKISLLSAENNFIEIGYVSTDIKAPNINTNWEMKTDKMHWNNGMGVHFTRQIYVDGYVIRISDLIKNNLAREISVAPYANIVRDGGDSMSSVVDTGGVVYANSKLDYTNWNKLNKKSVAYSTVRGSFGFADQYWETIASIDTNDQTISLKKSGDLYFSQTSAAPIKIAAKSEQAVNTYIFAGPRMSNLLNDAADKIPGINKTMDYGWFWFFAQPMLWLINWLNTLVGNYGVAIILMTLILRVLIWPLTRKSFVSTMKMQKMQPELQRVQKLYANDKARLQIEMMKVYQEHRTSPMSGCLPMLIQIPIFFALYKALLISVPMRSAHFLWISDLAAMDPYFILPILMGATMWLQQYLQTSQTSNNPNDMMASTQRIMKWMPVLFTIMFAWMPAGLVLYWTVSNLFGILQMYIIKKTMK